jgi:anti-sigma B factor antagonist
MAGRTGPGTVRSVKPASEELTPDGGQRAAQPDREQLISVRSSERDDAIILSVAGDIDGLTALRLRAAIDEAFDRLDGRLLVIDLVRVRFLGSAGLRTLRDTAAESLQHRRNSAQPLRIVVDETRPVIRPIEIVGLDQILALYGNVSEALAGGTLQQE